MEDSPFANPFLASYAAFSEMHRASSCDEVLKTIRKIYDFQRISFSQQSKPSITAKTSPHPSMP